MSRPAVLALVRTWLPAAVVLGGILLIAIERTEVALEGGAGIIGAGLSIWLFNWLMRVGNSGEADRHDEQEQRAFFDRHGVWPDEASPELLERLARGEPDARPTPGRRSDAHRAGAMTGRSTAPPGGPRRRPRR